MPAGRQVSSVARPAGTVTPAKTDYSEASSGKPLDVADLVGGPVPDAPKGVKSDQSVTPQALASPSQGGPTRPMVAPPMMNIITATVVMAHKAGLSRLARAKVEVSMDPGIWQTNQSRQ